MKRFIFFFLITMGLCLNMKAGESERVAVNAGYMLPNTIYATVGYEKDMRNGNAFEIFGELGDQWQHPTCHRFWKGYYWDGGANYKYALRRFKNGNFRIFGGCQLGSVQTKFFLGVRAGFEYNYVFANNWVLSVQQLNTVNFIHGRTFRNGISIGVKIPF